MTFERVEVIMDNSVKDFEDLEIIFVVLIHNICFVCLCIMAINATLDDTTY